jgi:lysophospholipase L1-like esterase
MRGDGWSSVVLLALLAACGSSHRGQAASTTDSNPEGGSGAPGSDDGGTAAADASSLPGVRLWIAGDSTVQNYTPGNMQGDNGAELEGWGQEIGQFFIDKVAISNEAVGGRSVALFMYAVAKDSAGNYQCVDDQGDPQYLLDNQGNHIDNTPWATIKMYIKPGDYLLIQFGTNDATHTCPRYVSTADFETDLGIMADAVRAKGATPIFVTPMALRAFNADGTVNNTLLPYADAMKDEAMMKGVEVADLNASSVAYYQMVGSDYLAANIFDGGTTHFIKAGAVKMAELLAGEIRKNGGPLAVYLK